MPRTTPESQPPTITELTDIAISYMGLSPDAHYTAPGDRVSVMAAGVAERSRIASLDLSSSMVQRLYHGLLNDGHLPSHLALEPTYLRRYDELIGVDEEGIRSEITDTIKDNIDSLPAEVRTTFEKGVGFHSSQLLHEAKRIPNNIAIFAHLGVTTLEAADNSLLTGDGLDAELPLQHAGVVHCFPDTCDVIGRIHEAQSGHPRAWQNVALLSSTHFTETYSKGAASALNLSAKRLFTSHEGPAKGMAALREEMKGNKRLKRGYGAIIMNDIEAVPMDDLYTTITIAPDVLAPRGLLLISARSRFPNGEGGVLDLIGHAKQVFGQSPQKIGALTIEEVRVSSQLAVHLEDPDDGGKQAFFMKQ